MTSWSIREIDETNKQVEIAFINEQNLISGVRAESVKTRLIAGGWPKVTPPEVYWNSSRTGVVKIDSKTGEELELD